MTETAQDYKTGTNARLGETTAYMDGNLFWYGTQLLDTSSAGVRMGVPSHAKGGTSAGTGFTCTTVESKTHGVVCGMYADDTDVTVMGGVGTTIQFGYAHGYQDIMIQVTKRAFITGRV